MSKSRVASSNSSTSVTRLWHQPAAKWSSYLYFHLLVRLGVFLRRIRRRFGGIGAQAPAGPQNFQQLLEEHQKGRIKYAIKHQVSVDWYLPASQDAFAGDAGKSYFDWSTSRILRFQPKRGAAVKRTVFYFNGGAFISTATTAHSFACSVLAHRLDACVYMFPYELAPTGCAASELPNATDFYLRVSIEARKAGHEIIIAGDSAGGSITACMPQCIQRFGPMLLESRPGFQDVNKLQPDQLLLISPLVTCHATPGLDERMDQLQAEDWWLTRSFVTEVSQLWVGSPSQHATVVSHLVDSSPSDDTAAGWKATLPTRTDSPIVDPTGSSDAFALLRESNVHVTLLCGTKDVLYAHSELYAELCDQNRVRCTYIQGDGGIHVYPILGYLGGGVEGCNEAIELCIASILKASRVG